MLSESEISVRALLVLPVVFLQLLYFMSFYWI